jgi:hypothetical protein
MGANGLGILAQNIAVIVPSTLQAPFWDSVPYDFDPADWFMQLRFPVLHRTEINRTGNLPEFAAAGRI